jgi:glycosyltransferase involved in cell wall biosynthesis
MYNLYGPLAGAHELWWICPSDRGDEGSSARMFRRLGVIARPVRIPRDGQSDRWLARTIGAVSGDHFWWFHHQEITRELDSLLGNDFDAVVVETEVMATYAGLAKPDVPWILSTQNLPSAVARRVLQTAQGAKAWLRAWFNHRNALRFENRLFPRFSAIAVVSDLDREMLVARFGGVHVRTVPNGVDFELVDRHYGSPSDERLLSFAGNFRYPPNRDAIQHFCSSILPLILQRNGEVRLELIGKDSVEFRASLPPTLPVSALGYVDDATAHVARASTVVAPLRVGGGTRIKILEAIGLGKPVVATSVGAEGLDLDASCGLLVADDPLDYAEMTLRALGDPAVRDAATTRGRTKVMADYTWESASRKFAELIDLTVREHRAGRSA